MTATALRALGSPHGVRLPAHAGAAPFPAQPPGRGGTGACWCCCSSAATRCRRYCPTPTPTSTTTRCSSRRTPEHWFGTNALGQDLLAQTLRGMQKSMLIGVCVAVISTGIAATVGSIAGYFGGWRDRALMWLVDLLLVVPGFILISIITPRTKNPATSSC